MNVKTQDRIGHRFGRLIVLDVSLRKSKHGDIYVLCLCDCGNKRETKIGGLVSGNTKSCGCLNLEGHPTHGKAGTKMYIAWQGMIKRCEYKKDINFKNYGARGITVCKRWHKFKNFYKDMGDRPEGRSLDRIDNNKGYSKNNCRWATREEQNNNKKSNVTFLYKGEVITLKQLSKMTGIAYDSIRVRIKYGWNLEKIINTPVLKKLGYSEISAIRAMKRENPGMSYREIGNLFGGRDSGHIHRIVNSL